MIATFDDVQQSAVNVNVQPLHAVGFIFEENRQESNFLYCLIIKVLHHSLLSNVNPLERPAFVTGNGDHDIKLLHKGTLAKFHIECYSVYESVGLKYNWKLNIMKKIPVSAI